MKTISLVGAFAFMVGVSPAANPELSLLQSAQTTRQSGAPTQQQPLPPAVVGVPVPTGTPQQPSRPAPGQPQTRTGGRGASPQQAPGAVPPQAMAPGGAGAAAARTPARAGAVRSADGDTVDFEFVQASLDSVVRTIMKELGYSYIIDPQVTGEVTVYTQGRLPRQQLFPILEQLLEMNGYGIVRQGEMFVILPLGQSPKIPGTIMLRPLEQGGAPAASGGSQQPEAQEPGQPPQTPPGSSPPPAQQRPDLQSLSGVQGVITYIIPLHYIPSSEMVTMAQAFVSEGATIVDFQTANTLLITDYRANIEQVLNLVHLLDTRYFDLNTIELVPVRYNKAADVAEDLGKVFAPGDKAGGVRIVAIERLNSILLVTRAPGVLADVKTWLEKLDAPSTHSSVKTFVYQVENNTAANIAEILAQLYEDGAGLPSSPAGQEEEQTQPARRRPAGFLPEGQQPTGALGPALSSRSAQSGVRAVVSGNVKIIVNEFNNSLIIQGTEADYQFLRATIEQLDVLPRQVLIEARIYTVELQDDLSFGVNAFLRERGSVGTGGDTTISDMLPPPTVGSLTTGGLSASTRVFVGFERQLDLLIDALRRKTNVEMLEAPTLLVVDGTEAQINVGAEVPVSTGSFGDPVRSGQTAAFVNTISFRPTGTTLLLLPRISASGIVNLDLAIEVSAAVGDPLIPTINRNYVQTSLIARDNETIAIAGVISDSLNKSRTRIPLLGDIPVLGAIFGQTSRNKRRFELIFLITPRVVRNVATAVELTLDFRRALRNAYGFVERMERQEEELIERRRREELEGQPPPPPKIIDAPQEPPPGQPPLR